LFATITGLGGAAAKINTFRRSSPDNRENNPEIELSFHGPSKSSSGKAIGCDPFFKELNITEKDCAMLHDYTRSFISSTSSSSGSDDQESSSVLDVLTTLISRVSLAAENPEYVQ
jgi:hypothetical protein